MTRSPEGQNSLVHMRKWEEEMEKLRVFVKVAASSSFSAQMGYRGAA